MRNTKLCINNRPFFPGMIKELSGKEIDTVVNFVRARERELDIYKYCGRTLMFFFLSTYPIFYGNQV